MNEYFIDRASEKLLLGKTSKDVVELDLPSEIVESIKSRIIDIKFDCTPNWGINGLRETDKITKNNWYFRDPSAKKVAEDRYGNIDQEKLKPILEGAVRDMVGSNASLIGYGLYGSYFYRRNALLPEDIDILLITGNIRCIAFDALKYRSSELKDIFINKSKLRPKTDEIGITIISEDELRPDNASFIVSDAALLDISTTFSQGKAINAPSLPPFIVIQNAQKIVNWGISSILSKPFSLLSRIDEAIRMRQMVLEEHPHVGFDKFAIEEALPSKEDILLGMNDTQLIELSRSILNTLIADEEKVRSFIAERIRSTK